jgi:hypothetical protein
VTWADWLETTFPNLKADGYELKSPATPYYNCIAWAAGDSQRFWWPTAPPVPPYYWPGYAPRAEDLESFRIAFEGMGYLTCEDGSLEPRLEKIAIYSVGDRPKHAARQLEDGRWASKCGKAVDIYHGSPQGVADGSYGQVSFFMRRSRTSGYTPPEPPPFP